MAPLYDYECQERICGAVVEVNHPIAGPTDETDLPEDVFFYATGVLGHHCGGNASGPMLKLISAPHVVTIVRGNQDYAARERERLTKRSSEHFDKVGRKEAIDRAEAKGHAIPTGWLKKQVTKTRRAR